MPASRGGLPQLPERCHKFGPDSSSSRRPALLGTETPGARIGRAGYGTDRAAHPVHRVVEAANSAALADGNAIRTPSGS